MGLIHPRNIFYIHDKQFFRKKYGVVKIVNLKEVRACRNYPGEPPP